MTGPFNHISNQAEYEQEEALGMLTMVATNECSRIVNGFLQWTANKYGWDPIPSKPDC